MVSSARRRKRGIEKAVSGQRKGEADDARSPRAVLSLPWSNVGIYEAQGREAWKHQKMDVARLKVAGYG